MEHTTKSLAFVTRITRQNAGGYVRVKQGHSTRRSSPVIDRVDLLTVPDDRADDPSALEAASEANTERVGDMLATLDDNLPAWLEYMQPDHPQPNLRKSPRLHVELDPVRQELAQRIATTAPEQIHAESSRHLAVSLERMARNADQRAEAMFHESRLLLHDLMELMRAQARDRAELEVMRVRLEYTEQDLEAAEEAADAPPPESRDAVGQLVQAWAAQRLGIDPAFLSSGAPSPRLPGPVGADPKSAALGAVNAFRAAVASDPTILGSPEVADAVDPLIRIFVELDDEPTAPDPSAPSKPDSPADG